MGSNTSKKSESPRLRFRQENYDPEEKERRHEIEALRVENKRLKEVSASNLEASMESFKLVCERDRKVGEKLRAAHFIHLTQEPGQVIYRYEDYRDLIMEMVRSKATYDGEYDAVSAGKPSTPIPVFENALRKAEGSNVVTVVTFFFSSLSKREEKGI